MSTLMPGLDFEAQLLAASSRGLAHRPCGECNQCCITFRINQAELRKEAGVPCQHLAECGCGIYATRPIVCRAFLCLWRLLKELPDEARPDKCGVVFAFRWHNDEPDPFKHFIIAIAVNGPTDFAQPEVLAALHTLVQGEAMPVWLSHGDKRTRIFPEDDLADAILNPGTTPHRHLLGRADQLRRKWLESPPADGPSSAPAGDARP